MLSGRSAGSHTGHQKFGAGRCGSDELTEKLSLREADKNPDAGVVVAEVQLEPCPSSVLTQEQGAVAEFMPEVAALDGLPIRHGDQVWARDGF